MLEFFNKLYKGGKNSFYSLIVDSINNNNKMFIITANPETFMIGTNDSNMGKAINNRLSVVVPDGIGIIKAANYLGYSVNEKITGVDITKFLLEKADELQKKIYFYGATQEVLSLLISKIKKEYPGIIITGSKNGYQYDDDKIMQEAISLESDIVIVALGIPRQEVLINNYIDCAPKGIFIGVGGSFDVISGYKKRAPEFFVKRNVEWLYRIMSEPKRLNRFFKSNVRFIKNTIEMKFCNKGM